MESLLNPQEPPSLPAPFHIPSCDTKSRPFCIYDIFLDLPHPAASGERAIIIDPPATVCPIVSREIYDPENIARMSRFTFPDHDEYRNNDTMSQEAMTRRRTQPTSGPANLTKSDVYLLDFVAHHHTFSVLLSDGRTRLHAHVRRYLPRHDDALSRTDVGRRMPRAMVIFTRAIGAERFYSSLLKTVEAISVEAHVNMQGSFATKKSPTRAFLHAVFNRHATLTTEYAELRRQGLGINFLQNSAIDATYDGDAACENARCIMENNESMFKVVIENVEFGCRGKKNGRTEAYLHIQDDVLQFYLPPSLQPGFDCVASESIPEDFYSPIVPLLRYIGPSHFVRLLSALLCERRIIFMSKSITRLSMCVRAASSILAQGLLAWKHVLIPVMPPDMLESLSVKAPYLVGILTKYAKRLLGIKGLKDVLCVNVDTNEVSTVNMDNSAVTVPYLLKKNSARKSDAGISTAEMLANDLDAIFQVDQMLWQHDGKSGGGGNKVKEDINELSPSEFTGDGMMRRSTIMDKFTKQATRRVSVTAKTMRTLAEKRQYAGSVDAAIEFGRMIRANFANDTGDKFDLYSSAEDDSHGGARKYLSPSQDLMVDMGCIEAATVAENDGGEEDVRAALTCFFIDLYGDMGMYLSETRGQFWLDRRKFLLRKKQLGEKENSPMFLVLIKLCTSPMFESFTRGRIDDIFTTPRQRSGIFPHHIPLFDICTKYLSMNRLEFSVTNVRRIVAATVIKCTRHIAVERSESIRTRVLSLTSDTTSGGNIATELSDLVSLCHNCNSILSVVMSVIWHRLGNAKSNFGRHLLLALHLLKALILHGPLTAISEALDGVEEIYSLRSFSNSKELISVRVRVCADSIFDLLSDLRRLYDRRRRIAYSKLQQTMPPRLKTWGDYLVKRLPFSTDPRIIHSLFSPDGVSRGRFFDNQTNSSSFENNFTSLKAIRRIEDSMRLKGTYHQYYEDEEEKYETIGSDPYDRVESFRHPKEIEHYRGTESMGLSALQYQFYVDDNEITAASGRDLHGEGERFFHPHESSEQFRDSSSYEDDIENMSRAFSFHSHDMQAECADDPDALQHT